tara:strand:+ start:1161 stop:1484 length:324 start_codon:yes stop_codon:yes gene_type:complete
MRANIITEPRFLWRRFLWRRFLCNRFLWRRFLCNRFLCNRFLWRRFLCNRFLCTRTFLIPRQDVILCRALSPRRRLACVHISPVATDRLHRHVARQTLMPILLVWNN